MWVKLGETLDRKAYRARIAEHLRGQRKVIAIGRSRNSAGFGSSTPIEIVDGDSPPELIGQPYLMTTMENGPNFRKTLYTPSTLRVVVGREW